MTRSVNAYSKVDTFQKKEKKNLLRNNLDGNRLRLIIKVLSLIFRNGKILYYTVGLDKEKLSQSCKPKMDANTVHRSSLVFLFFLPHILKGPLLCKETTVGTFFGDFKVYCSRKGLLLLSQGWTSHSPFKQPWFNSQTVPQSQVMG